MHGERMSEQVRRNRFGNPTPSSSLLARLFHGVLADGLAWPIAREQPRGRSFHSPPRAEQLQQLRREHHVAILLTFPLLDTNDHATAVDILRSQVEHFGNAESRGVAGRENRA